MASVSCRRTSAVPRRWRTRHEAERVRQDILLCRTQVREHMRVPGPMVQREATLLEHAHRRMVVWMTVRVKPVQPHRPTDVHDGTQRLGCVAEAPRIARKEIAGLGLVLLEGQTSSAKHDARIARQHEVWPATTGRPLEV